MLRTAKLQVITDLRGGEGFPGFCQRLYDAGVDMIQVRDTDLEPQTRRAVLQEARQVAFAAQRLLVVGRDLDTAVALEADVYHAQASDGQLDQVRSRLHRYALVGQSVHTAAEMVGTDADYLLVGPVLSRDPDDRVGGLRLVEAAARAQPVTDPQSVPWFAVGGITPTTLDEVLAAGAVRVAVSSAVTEADDPVEVARVLAEQVGDLWRARDDLRRVVLASLGGGGGVFASTAGRSPRTPSPPARPSSPSAGLP